MEWKIKSFEELSLKELYEILCLRSEVFIVEQTCPYQDVDRKDYHSFHLFLEDHGEIVSYLRVIPKGISYDDASIGRVVVKPTYRNQGVAKIMMNKAINYLINTMHEEKIRISAQAYLLHFYESFGFKQVSGIYLEDDIEHTEMLYEVG